MNTLDETIVRPRLHPNNRALFAKLDTDIVTRLYFACAAFCVAVFLALVPAWMLDQRMLDNAAIWTKPQKFNLSLALHFATLLVLSQLLPRAVRSGRVMVIAAYAAASALLFETIYIGLQAARGTRSHYNADTPLEDILYAAMGVGAVILIAAALVLAIQIWRHGERSRKGLWLGSVVGLSSGFVATLAFTATLSSVGRYVGAPLEGGGEVIPLLGWSREYGDLRPAHFVALHLMQTIPLIGWLADRRGWNPVWSVFGALIVQILLACALFAQAMAGRPLWPV